MQINSINGILSISHNKAVLCLNLIAIERLLDCEWSLIVLVKVDAWYVSNNIYLYVWVCMRVSCNLISLYQISKNLKINLF